MCEPPLCPLCAGLETTPEAKSQAQVEPEHSREFGPLQVPCNGPRLLRTHVRPYARAARRWRRASYNSSAAATLTLSESTVPSREIATASSQRRRTSGRRPIPSAPKTRTAPPLRSASHIVVDASPAAAYTQRSARLTSSK